MKLWYLTARSDSGVYTGYDSMDDIVVRAPSEKVAREIAAEMAGAEGADVWTDNSKTECTKLSNAGAQGVICRSFLAG